MSDGAATFIIELGKRFAPLARLAVRVFFNTALGLTMICAAMAYAAWQSTVWMSPKQSALTIGTVILIFVIGGFILSVKRAFTSILIEAVDSLDLGPKLMDLIFSQMLEVESKDIHGSRGVSMVRVAENLPLKTAEGRLTHAVQRVLQAPTDQTVKVGYVKKRFLTLLLDKVHRVTLAEFRRVNQAGECIYLILVQERLGEEIEARILDLTRSAGNKTTLLFVSGLILCAIGAVYGFSQFWS